MTKFKVGKEDEDLLSFSRHLRTCANGPSYFKRTLPRPKRGDVYLHRMIMERIVGRKLAGREIVDHINRDTTDNRRENLRLVNKSENAANSDRKNPHANIYWYPKRRMWRVQFEREKKQFSAGYFEEIGDAIIARDIWLKDELLKPKKVTVTKHIEAWANVYAKWDTGFYTTETLANECQYSDRIACVKLAGSYEVEE